MRGIVEKILKTEKGCVIITENSESLAKKGAALFLQHAGSAVKQRGRFSVVLSGRSTIGRSLRHPLAALSRGCSIYNTAAPLSAWPMNPSGA